MDIDALKQYHKAQLAEIDEEAMRRKQELNVECIEIVLRHYLENGDEYLNKEGSVMFPAINNQLADWGSPLFLCLYRSTPDRFDRVGLSIRVSASTTDAEIDRTVETINKFRHYERPCTLDGAPHYNRAVIATGTRKPFRLIQNLETDVWIIHTLDVQGEAKTEVVGGMREGLVRIVEACKSL